MKKRSAAFLFAILFALGILLLAGMMAFVYSGIYNVAAAKAHAPVFRWVVTTAMERSVKFHAEELPAPDLSDSSLLKHGAKHFKTMCVTCHGEPGREPSDIGKGLNPKAPELSKTAGEWTDSEIHWIIKNGIRMTGMPAFGQTHDEKEIWGLVAFVRAMAGLSPEKYQRILKTLLGDPEQEKGIPEEQADRPVPWKKKSLF